MTEANDLSDRELEILQLVATGASNKEIAQKLYISSNTVKVHLRNIFAKINVASRTEAAMFAVQHGYVDTPQQVSEEGLSIDDSGEESIATAHESRVRPLVLWSVLVIAVLLGFAGILALTFNETPQAVSVSSPIPTKFPRWEEKSHMPTARFGFAAIAYENMIYAIAGEDESEILGTVERYNPETNSWDSLADKPLPVSDVKGEVIGGKIYIPGGRLLSGDITNALEIYNPREDKWELGASVPINISAYDLAAFEGKLYLFGGWDGERYLDSVYEYDPVLDQWTERTAMPIPRAYAGAAVSSGKIFVIGGENLNGPLSLNEVYTPELENSEISPWEEAEPLPEERSGVGVVNVVDNIFVIGGQNPDGSIAPSYIYVPTGDVWQSFELPISQGWSRMGLSLVGKELYMLGGDISDVPSDGNYVYQAIFTVSFPVIVK